MAHCTGLLTLHHFTQISQSREAQVLVSREANCQVTEVELWALAPYPATSSCSLPSSLSITDVELKGDVALWSVIVRIANQKKNKKQNKYNHII